MAQVKIKLTKKGNPVVKIRIDGTAVRFTGDTAEKELKEGLYFLDYFCRGQEGAGFTVVVSGSKVAGVTVKRTLDARGKLANTIPFVVNED